MLARFKEEERRKLSVQIEEWNSNKLDMFTLSQPDENLEFFGVMRFFFQEDPSKTSTKCVRVSSTASCYDVIGALIEKFRPDMKMLGDHDYALYEVHDKDERKMLAGERPLLVQLNWAADDREGMFVLKEISIEQSLSKRLSSSVGDLRNEGMERRLSKRQRKQLKKQQREQEKKLQEQQQSHEISSFMRSLSNPELVLRKRRQVKLEKKLNDIASSQNGGTLKIYGHSLKPDVPYKTLLLSTEDKVEEVVAEALEKYGFESENSDTFCLVQVMLPPGAEDGSSMVQERIMEEDECPLSILMQHPQSLGTMKFHLRIRPPNAPKKKKAPNIDQNYNFVDPRVSQYASPFLLPIRADGSDKADQLRCFLAPGRTSVGKNDMQNYQLIGPDVQNHHCDLIRDADDTVWLEEMMGVVMVDGQRCIQPVPLKHGSVVQIGNSHLFRFINPLSIGNVDFRSPNDNINNMSVQNNYQLKNLSTPQFRQNNDVSNYNKNLNTDNYQAYNINPTISNNLNAGRLKQSPSNSSIGTKDLETTFDLEGHVITAPSIQPSIQMPLPQSFQTLNLLPAMFYINEQAEDLWLEECTHRLNFASLHLKIAPSLLFYLSIRSKLPDKLSANRLASKISSRVASLVQDNPSNPPLLSFWLSNCSELFNFLHLDLDLSSPTQQACSLLLQVIQNAFGSFLECLQVEMELTLPSFVNPHPDTSHFEEDFLGRKVSPTLANLLHVLTLAMSVLRRCRVNAGITIQIFTQLFKFANAWLFNCILLDSHIGLCCSDWGEVIRVRIEKIVSWAEKQGLELAAQCHFAKSLQLCTLLETPKSSTMQFNSMFPLLNPSQIYSALHKFQPPLSQSFLNLFNPYYESSNHQNSQVENIEESLEACPTLILPEDGFCSDSINGIPQAFIAFVDNLEKAGYGQFVINPGASGLWNVYIKNQINDEEKPKASVMRLKKINKSLGVSIVSAKSSEQMETGIYVKSIVEGGAAQLDGRLEPGDQLLSVEGKSLVGITQEKAAQMMAATGEVVELVVLKQGAIFNNLPSLIPQYQIPDVETRNSTQFSSSRFTQLQPPVPQPRNQQLVSQDNVSRQIAPQQISQTRQISSQHPNHQLHDQSLLSQEDFYHKAQRNSQDLINNEQQRFDAQQPTIRNTRISQNMTNESQNYKTSQQFELQQSRQIYLEQNNISRPPIQPMQRHSVQPQNILHKDNTNLSLPISNNTQPLQVFNQPYNTLPNSSTIPNQHNQNLKNPNLPISHTSTILSNFKLTRPLSSLSSKKPGYASQVLFPKNHSKTQNDDNINNNNNDNNTFLHPNSSSFDTNDLKRNSINANSHKILNNQVRSEAPIISQKPPTTSYYSPPLPSPNHFSPSQQQFSDQEFPSPPMQIPINNLNINQNSTVMFSNPPTNSQPLNPKINTNVNPFTSNSKLPPPVPAKPKVAKSPWEREAAEKKLEEERKGKQMQEMLNLQAKVHRTSEEETRFRKLQTEEEFERRARQAEISLEPSTKEIATPGPFKKSVTFSENVGINEYYRSLSSTSSDLPPSPHPPSIPVSNEFSKQVSNLSYYESDLNPVYYSNPNNAYQQTSKVNHQFVQPHNMNPDNIIVQPRNISSGVHQNYQNNQLSQPASHLFENVYNPQNILENQPNNSSQQREIKHVAKIDQGPVYEIPVDYQIKAKVNPNQHLYSQPSKLKVEHTDDIKQSSYDTQNNIHPQSNYYSQEPFYQQTPFTYNAPDIQFQRSDVNDQTKRFDNSVYSRHTQNQNVMNYTYD